MNGFTTAFVRTVQIGVRHPLDSFNPIGFLIIVTALTSIAVTAVAESTRDPLAIALLWITMLLATMLTCTSVFEQDFDDGSLELIVSQQPSLFATVHGAVAAHWLLNVLPLIVLIPLGAWMFNLSLDVLWVLTLSFTAGSIVFVWFGVLGASLTLGTSRGGLLLAILILPLYVPVLLLGVGGAQRYAAGEPYLFAVVGIWALAVGTLTFMPFAVAALLKASLEY